MKRITQIGAVVVFFLILASYLTVISFQRETDAYEYHHTSKRDVQNPASDTIVASVAPVSQASQIVSDQESMPALRPDNDNSINSYQHPAGDFESSQIIDDHLEEKGNDNLPSASPTPSRSTTITRSASFTSTESSSQSTTTTLTATPTAQQSPSATPSPLAPMVPVPPNNNNTDELDHLEVRLVDRGTKFYLMNKEVLAKWESGEIASDPTQGRVFDDILG